MIQTSQALATPTATPVGWEPVHFVSNHYDFPLEGLADFNGAPHFFFLVDEQVVPVPAEADEDDAWDRVATYALHPMSPDLVADMLEKHAIFERWHQAYCAQTATIKDHPALSEDRARRAQLAARLDPLIKQLRATPAPHERIGEFAGARRPVPQGCSRWQSFEVQWRPVEADPRA